MVRANTGRVRQMSARVSDSSASRSAVEPDSTAATATAAASAASSVSCGGRQGGRGTVVLVVLVVVVGVGEVGALVARVAVGLLVVGWRGGLAVEGAVEALIAGA